MAVGDVEGAMTVDLGKFACRFVAILGVLDVPPDIMISSISSTSSPAFVTASCTNLVMLLNTLIARRSYLVLFTVALKSTPLARLSTLNAALVL